MLTRLSCLCVFLSAWVVCHAQSMAVPIAGTVLTPQGTIDLVPGVLGNLLPGRQMQIGDQDNILSAAFSSTGGLVKTTSKLLTVDLSGNVLSRRDAPAGNAIFAFAADGIQLAYFPESRVVQPSHGAAIDASAWGDVVALGNVDANSLSVVTLHGTQLWAESIALPTGTITSQTPLDGAVPCVFFAGGWLRKNIAGLIWDPVTPTVQHRDILIPVGVETLQTAGAHSVGVNGHWLLLDTWQLLEIPAPSKTHTPSALHPPRGFGK